MGLGPSATIIVSLVGAGAFILMCAAFWRVLHGDDAYGVGARSQDQENYMREVRQRNYDDMAAGRRPIRGDIHSTLPTL